MAEAGPSSPSGTQPTPVHAISPSTSFSKQARIHFPHDNPDAGHYTSKGPNSHSQLPTWGLGRPRRLTQKDSNGPVSRPADARPRVQSVDSNSHRAGPSRLYRAEQLGIDFPVRNRRSRKDKGRAVAEHPDMAGTFTTTAFSDEFDLGMFYCYVPACYLPNMVPLQPTKASDVRSNSHHCMN